MHKSPLLISGLFAVSIAAFACASIPAAASDFATPEQAIATYIEGVAAGDLARVLDTTAIEEMKDGFDFVGYVDRLRALVLTTPAPADEPFFADINAVYFTATITGQVKMLAYGLLTRSPVVDGETVLMDGEAAAAFAAQLDTSRLERLRLEAVALSNPALMAGERYIANAEKFAQHYGADEWTERVALLSFEGLHYVIGFTLVRYGENWKISSQYSPIAATNNLGGPKPTTPEEFRQSTQ